MRHVLADVLENRINRVERLEIRGPEELHKTTTFDSRWINFVWILILSLTIPWKSAVEGCWYKFYAKIVGLGLATTPKRGQNRPISIQCCMVSAIWTWFHKLMVLNLTYSCRRRMMYVLWQTEVAGSFPASWKCRFSGHSKQNATEYPHFRPVAIT